MHFNLSYAFRQPGGLVEEAESERGERLTRVERFALNVSRVDQLTPAIGIEGVFKHINPFLEWSVDIPANRQNYACATADLNASDVCLDSYGAFDAAPSRLTLGARGYALLDGLSIFGALDVATGGVNSPFWGGDDAGAALEPSRGLGVRRRYQTQDRTKFIKLKPKETRAPET